MKRIITFLMLSLLLITGTTFSQEQSELHFEVNSDLVKEQENLWIAYGINPHSIKEISIGYSEATPEETLKTVRELVKG